MDFFFSFFLVHVLSFITFSGADPIATSITVPPLQWLNLTGLLSGNAAPPPLKNAAIGYHDDSRTLIVFGGESAAGVPQGSTYLLNLDNLTWSVPSGTSADTPSARSLAVAGCDFAASNRNGFVVIGGKGSSGQALSDIWEFDFTSQFWGRVSVSAGGPGARWGSVGGIDVTTSPIQDPVVPGPNNTLYLIGGTDGNQAFSLSDVWRFNISGTLSSNLPDAASGSWDRMHIGDLPARTDGGGAVIGSTVINVGGCSSSPADNKCEQQDSYVLSTSRQTSLSPQGCPIPRTLPAVTPNLNRFAQSFSSQVFMLLGTFDDTIWKDDGYLDKGEVDILDIDTGQWSRVVCSGDPGNDGTERFPSARSGAASVSFTEGLVGSSRSGKSDTIIFGGQDASGTYLNELWILRAYDGSITTSNPQWSGYGSGALESGVNADGTHVSVQILDTCAKAVDSSHTTSGTTSGSTPTGSASPTSSSLPDNQDVYDTSFYHKLFAPLSLVLFLPAIVFFRLSAPVYTGQQMSQRPMISLYTAGLLATVAYGLGVAGLALSFTSVTETVQPSFSKRAISSKILQTTHGRVGLAFWVGLYAVVPVCYAVLMLTRHGLHRARNFASSPHNNATMSPEKPGSSSPFPMSNDTDAEELSGRSTPRGRTSSLGTTAMLRPSQGEATPSTESLGSAPVRSFEVVNRPPHRRKAGPAAPIMEASRRAQRDLAQISWMHRRRSLNAVDELDYAITQVIRQQQANADASPAPASAVSFPPWSEILVRFLLHFFLLGLCVIALVALWHRGPRATFGVFLAWVFVVYIVILGLSVSGRPPFSVISISVERVRAHRETATPDTELQDTHSGPYLHGQSYRAASTDRQDAVSSGHGVYSDEGEGSEDDEDEESRQYRIEQEMDRRDVALVTVPKRKLWITNPSRD